MGFYYERVFWENGLRMLAGWGDGTGIVTGWEERNMFLRG